VHRCHIARAVGSYVAQVVRIRFRPKTHRVVVVYGGLGPIGGNMSFSRVPWVIAVAALVLAGVLGWAYAGARREATEATRRAEAQQLKANQIIVDEQKNASALRKDLERLTKQNDDLKAELDRVLKAAPGAKVQTVGHFSTGPVPAGGKPRTDPPPGDPAAPGAPAPRRFPRVVPHPLRPGTGGHLGSRAAPRGAWTLAQAATALSEAPQRPGTGPLPAGGAARAPALLMPEGGVVGGEATAAAPAQGTCLLAVGDTGEVVVDQVTVKTEAGNYIVVGAASANRLAPPPETAMLHGPFRAPVSESSRLREEVRTGRSWGFGAYAGAWDGGRTIGAALALPQARVLGHALEGIVTVGVWPEMQAGALAVARW
jgi:hypothetical protein